RGLFHAPLQHRLVGAPLHQQLPALERALGGDEQLLDIDRFHDEVVGAELEAVDGRFHVGGAGEYNHRGGAVGGTNLLEQLDPRHHRHLEIRDDQLRAQPAEGGETGASVLSQAAGVARRQKDLVQDLANLPIVIDDEDVPRANHAMKPSRPTPRRRPPGSSPPSWRRTALRRPRGTDPPPSLPRRPAGWPRRSWP